MSQANEPVVSSTAQAETVAAAPKAAKAKKPTSRRKPVPKATKASSEGPRVFFQNQEGRVFIGDEFLIKQFKKRKFGLARITKAVYEDAMANGGLTDPIEDFDDAVDEI